VGGLSVEQVLELAALRDDKLFYFYDDLQCLDQEPHGYRTAYEDHIAVTEEVYCRMTFCNCHVRSVSLDVSESLCLSVCLSVCLWHTRDILRHGSMQQFISECFLPFSSFLPLVPAFPYSSVFSALFAARPHCSQCRPLY